MKVCALADFISSMNDEDFGEDILVQTCIREEMDDSKMWIQVKGFKAKASASREAPVPKPVAISNRHLARWTKSADLAVIVRWDVANDCGWYLLPDESAYAKKIPIGNTGSQTIRFDPQQIFNVPAVKLLAWKARFRHAARNISVLAHARTLGELDGRESRDLQHDLWARIGQIAIDIGVLTPGYGNNSWQVTKAFQQLAAEKAHTLLDQDDPSSLALMLRASNQSVSELEELHRAIMEVVAYALIEFLDVCVPSGAIMPSELFAEVVEFVSGMFGSSFSRWAQDSR